ncbi:MAG: HAD family phosphatase [Dehalococcoidia bacterium]
MDTPTGADAIRAVIFDVYGVLIDLDGDLARIEDRHALPAGALRRAVFGIPEFAAVQAGAVTSERYFAAAARALERLAGRPAPEALAEWRSADRPLNHEVVELAAALRPRYTVAVLSNASARLRAMLDERYGIAGLFDPIIASGAVGLAKPDPAIFRLAAERIGASPECCIFIDDTAGHVAGAGAIGMRGITYTSFTELTAALRRLGVVW